MSERDVEKEMRRESRMCMRDSCNPATQARDQALLDEKYKVVKAREVDMFPKTSHCESVVRLELREE